MQDTTADGTGLSTNAIIDDPLSRAHSPQRFYRPELDGLRFYAFLGVFISHTLPTSEAYYRGLHLQLPWLWGAVVRAGTSGVDLFFALSAFLITSLLLKERLETGGVSLRLFYIRRILRIWPLYFLVIALGVLLAHTVPNNRLHLHYDQSLPWHLVVGYLLFVSNWMYVASGTVRSICAPLWTVSIEEQFYIVWPVLVKILRRRGIVMAGIAAFLLATLSQVGIVLAGMSGGYIYYGSASRSGSLALGILLATCGDRLPRPTTATRFLLVTGGLIGWVASAAWLTDQPGPLGMRMVLGRLIISLASVAILYGCLNSSNKLVVGRRVVRLGKISYGLYMLHFLGLLIVMSPFQSLHGFKLLATQALGFVMTVLLAIGSYRWVEAPFLRLKDRFATVLSRPV
jgi:peptidoglycan/LPS O-acetylase OafA/YrhL